MSQIPAVIGCVYRYSFFHDTQTTESTGASIGVDAMTNSLPHMSKPRSARRRSTRAIARRYVALQRLRQLVEEAEKRRAIDLCGRAIESSARQHGRSM